MVLHHTNLGLHALRTQMQQIQGQHPRESMSRIVAQACSLLLQGQFSFTYMFHTPIQGSTHQHLLYGWVQVRSMQGDAASFGEASGGAV